MLSIDFGNFVQKQILKSVSARSGLLYMNEETFSTKLIITNPWEVGVDDFPTAPPPNRMKEKQYLHERH